MTPVVRRRAEGSTSLLAGRASTRRRLYGARWLDRHGSDLRRSIVVLAALAAIAAGVRGSGLRIQHTASLPRGLYRTVAGTPDRGTIGLWCLPPAAAAVGRARGYLAAGACPDGVEPLGKIVLGIAGDTILYRPDGVTLNGRAIPNTRPLARDSRGRPLGRVPFGTYVLRTDEVWVWSPFSAASYDSRYFGPIPTSGFMSLVTPVWTQSPLPRSRAGVPDLRPAPVQ